MEEKESTVGGENMSKGIYIAGTGPQSGKSVVVLGVMELLAGTGGRSASFVPSSGKRRSDRFTALVADRYGIATRARAGSALP